MKQMYYYLTKYCFLTAFMGASIVWSLVGYGSFYERFNKIDGLANSIRDSIYKVCVKNKTLDEKTKDFEKIFKNLPDFSVVVTNKKYGKIYETPNYKSKFYMKDSFISGGFNVGPKEDSENYEYVIKYQYKFILPAALLKVWSFSAIPDWQMYKYITSNSRHSSFLKTHIIQSVYFWIMVFVFYSFLSFYRKELNLTSE